MSWQFIPTNEQTDLNQLCGTLQFKRDTEAEGLKTLRITSHKSITLAQDDELIVCVLGRIRPYNQNYDKHKYGANWFLSLYKQYRDTYYQNIAGFFIVVVLNKHNGQVSVINDHVASVPFYIDCQPTEWHFSDSLDTLQQQRQVPPAIHTQALYNYFYYHCIPSPLSVYQHIEKLTPGIEYQLSPDGTKSYLTRYQPDFTPSRLSDQQLRQQCQQVISDAVARNITDNCAAFLSGGLDSSTVAGMLAKNSDTARTYSIGFDAKGYDETEYALITAKHFNTQHKVHYLQPQEIIDNFAQVAQYFDEPFGNSSAMAAFICAKVAAEEGINVLLAGDGGDEIFAGNERYVKQKVFEFFLTLPQLIQKPLAAALVNTPAERLPVFKKASSYIKQAQEPLPGRLDSYNFLNRFTLSEMFCQDFLQSVDTTLPLKAKQQRYQACPSVDPVDRMMYLDWKFTLADNDFVKVSSMCQLAGVEVRYPLIEKEVVDFSCTVPADIKAPGQKLRDFYKRSFKGFLPDETLSKSKHGFGLPFGVWMKQQPELQRITLDSLTSLKKRNIIKASFIEHALNTYQQGHAGYYGELVWIMVTLELWLQKKEASYAA